MNLLAPAEAAVYILGFRCQPAPRVLIFACMVCEQHFFVEADPDFLVPARRTEAEFAAEWEAVCLRCHPGGYPPPEAFD